MNIPRKDAVSFVLCDTLRKETARSQKELSGMINMRLRATNSGYSISGSRVRMIALDTPGIRVSISTKKGPVPSRCPACGHSLRKSYTRNLKGRKVLRKLECLRCPYTGSGGKWAPSRYAFSLA